METCKTHKKAVDRLKSQLRNGMLPHAPLFVGPEGVGRLDVVRSLTAALFCTENPDSACGNCPSCRAFESGEHPDYREFGVPEGRRSLPIESIRELQTAASRKPVMGRLRAFTVRDAELMSTEAANCFLKTLEEPPGECYLFLIATGLRNLPETIVSRCQVIKLTGLDPETVKMRLCNDGIDPQDAAWLAMRSWGSPERASTFYGRKMHEFNRELVEKTLSMNLNCNFIMSDFFQESAKKSGADAAQQRTALQELLECLAVIYRDIATLIREPDGEIFNEHARDALAAYACDYDLDAALDCADKTLLALERIGANVNRRIALDDLFSSLPRPSR